MGLHWVSQHQRVPLTLVNNTWGLLSPYLVLFSTEFTCKQLAAIYYSLGYTLYAAMHELQFHPIQ